MELYIEANVDFFVRSSDIKLDLNYVWDQLHVDKNKQNNTTQHNSASASEAQN